MKIKCLIKIPLICNILWGIGFQKPRNKRFGFPMSLRQQQIVKQLEKPKYKLSTRGRRVCMCEGGGRWGGA